MYSVYLVHIYNLTLDIDGPKRYKNKGNFKKGSPFRPPLLLHTSIIFKKK